MTIRNLELEKEKVSLAEKEKIDFLRTASHELKTPVTELNATLENMILGIGEYFINCFMRNRYYHSVKMQELLKCYEATGNEQYLVELRTYLIKSYYLAEKDRDMSLFEVKRLAEWELTYRKWNTPEGSDGLDQARDCLRQLSVSNLPDTRLIICSMAGEKMYPYIDHMLLEPEFRELSEKVIISAAPDYLCQFTSSPAVLNYNASFAKAVEKK